MTLVIILFSFILVLTIEADEKADRYNPVANPVRLQISYADPVWKSKQIPIGKQCQRYGIGNPYYVTVNAVHQTTSKSVDFIKRWPIGVKSKNNATRYDPYKNYRFRVIMNNRTVLGIQKVIAQKGCTKFVKCRMKRNNNVVHKSMDKATCEGIILEKGMTYDIEFEKWVNMVHSLARDRSRNLINYKINLIIEVLNVKGAVEIRYFLHGCWVSDYTTLPELDAPANAVAIQFIKLEMKSCEFQGQGT